jgi:hypothetical protein
MASARSRRRGDAQNLDSLLDTMANVTGILVVLLAVTQLSVGDAMKRLRETAAARPELTHEAIELMQAEAKRIDVALAPLEPQSDALLDAHRSRRDTLALLRSENGERRKRIAAAADADPTRYHARIAEARRHARELENDLASARAQIGALDAELAESGLQAQPHEARLPDPRPPPAGATRIVYFARYGRIFRVRTDELFSSLSRGMLEATDGRWSYGSPPPLALDRRRVVDYFEQNDLGSRALRWHVVNSGTSRFQGQLEWRSQSHGETLAELARSDSVYRRDLSLLDPHRTYFQFYVWDDSFEVYLRAREQANELGFASGWITYDRTEPIFADLVSPEARPQID